MDDKWRMLGLTRTIQNFLDVFANGVYVWNSTSRCWRENALLYIEKEKDLVGALVVNNGIFWSNWDWSGKALELRWFNGMRWF